MKFAFFKKPPVLAGMLAVVCMVAGGTQAVTSKHHDASVAKTGTKAIVTKADTVTSNTPAQAATADKPKTEDKPAATPAPKPTTPTPTTTPPVSTPSTPTSSSHFNTLPVGSTLPNDATCASRVRSAAETRPTNSAANNTRGTTPNGRYPRVTGNFTGTTDEIIQWAACKWGIDEDVARAQAAIESWWFQRTTGDFTTDTSICVPGHRTLGADGHAGQCPESIGLLQVRYQYHLEAFTDNNATNSTAYNIDYMYAVWRDCYEGNQTWLNTVERGGTYAAGDAWGCVGVWFAGRWYTSPAVNYINNVKSYLNQRVWETANFKSAT